MSGITGGSNHLAGDMMMKQQIPSDLLSNCAPLRLGRRKVRDQNGERPPGEFLGNVAVEPVSWLQSAVEPLLDLLSTLAQVRARIGGNPTVRQTH